MVLAKEYSNNENELSDYINMFLEKHGRNSEETFKMYKNTLEMMSERLFDTTLMGLSIDDIELLTFDVIEKYKSLLLESGNSNGTVNSRISTIKSFIKYLCSVKAINYNIAELDLVETLKDDSEITELIPEETVFQYATYFEEHESRKGAEKKWATLMLLETGNRAEEVLGATKNQFTKDGDDYIFKSKGKQRGKGNVDYFERIGSELYDAIMALNPDSEKVFSISYDMLNNAFTRANEHFGNKLIKYTPHSLKHLAVTLEYNYTGCILQAQRKGKHANIDTTRRYLRLSEKLTVGAYTRRNLYDTQAYKNATLEDLISVIDELPNNMRQLINEKLQLGGK